MRTPVVVEVNPVPDEATGMLQRFKAVPMHALLLERANYAFDQAVLLWAVRRDELLAQPIASDQRREAATGENQPVEYHLKLTQLVTLTQLHIKGESQH